MGKEKEREPEVKLEPRDFDSKAWADQLGGLEDSGSEDGFGSDAEAEAESENEEGKTNGAEDYELDPGEGMGRFLEEQEESGSDEGNQLEQRPLKRVKIESPHIRRTDSTPLKQRPPPEAPLPNPTTIHSPNRRNVFSSPKKPPIQFRVAGARPQSPNWSEPSYASDEVDSPPVFQARRSGDVSESTDAVFLSPPLSPTLLAPAPSTVPEHLRSSTNLGEQFLSQQATSDSESDMIRVDLPVTSTQEESDDGDPDVAPALLQPKNLLSSQHSAFTATPHSSASTSNIDHSIDHNVPLSMEYGTSCTF